MASQPINNNEQTDLYNLSTQNASYQNGEQQGWFDYLASYGPWLKEKALMTAKFGAGAVSTLVSGTYSLVKDGVISLATKNVSDLVAAMATGLILTYSDFSPTTTAVTTFLVQQLARKAVSVARAELAKKAQPLSDAAAAKLQTIAYGIYATQLGLKEQQ